MSGEEWWYCTVSGSKPICNNTNHPHLVLKIENTHQLPVMHHDLPVVTWGGFSYLDFILAVSSRFDTLFYHDWYAHSASGGAGRGLLATSYTIYYCIVDPRRVNLMHNKRRMLLGGGGERRARTRRRRGRGGGRGGGSTMWLEGTVSAIPLKFCTVFSYSCGRVLVIISHQQLSPTRS